MAQDFGTPLPPVDAPPKRNNTVMIVVVVLLVLCCCCLLIGGLAYQFGDAFLEMFDIQTALPALFV